MLRGTDWASPETAFGTGEELYPCLVRLLDPGPTVPEARAAFGGLELVRHQNSIHEATAPVALFVAALLARRGTQRGGAADDVCAPLLGWLADVAHDCDDTCAAAGERGFDGNYL
ncbi:hypothetical protein [Kitasatospora aureofaciens]|uniref:hypothetical protein n=1 Tax=Kitasatospora aureofaciens TaxID=1894 RepID=UPI001C468DA8|nr:hypothetical protein [Kitasatospora aureofaciens]MBV6700321.1 hypothetical protein [Kitasatospora aureofaciens]